MQLILGQAPFEFISKINELDDLTVAGGVNVPDTDLLLEAMAQMAGIHARRLVDFSLMVLFVKVEDFTVPDDLPPEARVICRLQRRRGNYFIYDVMASWPGGQSGAKLHFAAVPYSDAYPPELAQFFRDRLRRALS